MPKPINSPTPPCTFCEESIVEGGYIQPPMCQKHHSLAILISLLKNRGQLASLENLRLLAAFFPRTGLRNDEIEALLEPMREHIHQERS